MTHHATRQLAEFVASTSLSHMPDEVIDRAKYFVLDYLGVALRGSLVDSSAAVRAFADRFAPPGHATIIGGDQGTHPAYAALANGAAAHCLEMDDTHQEGSIHLGAPVISALMAASEMQPASGGEFLTAVVLGYEVAARLAMAVGPEAHYRRGFHPTGTCGTFGAAAAVARLWGLEARAIAQALGIAGSQAAGSMEFLATGAWTKRFHPGWAAHNGLIAAALAREGFTGPETIIEGQAGFAQAYSQAPRPERVTQGLGTSFEILATAVKPHACCRYMQAPIDAMLDLVRTHHIAADDVAQVTLGILDTAFPIICEPAAIKYAPRSVVDAQFSMPFGAAVALLCRRASLAEFTPEMVAAPHVRALMQRVAHARDPELERHFPREWPAWASIALHDGRQVSTTVRYPKGDPQNPLSWDELLAKYRELGRSVLPEDRLDELAPRVRALESAPDVAPLWCLLRPTRASAAQDSLTPGNVPAAGGR
jgi:2-methylcitrate dehydratase PrpD